jgi:hypothetical protein
MDAFTIPEFCKIPQPDRRAAWVGRKLTKVKFITKTTRDEDASTRAFRREVERKAAAKVKAALDELHERERAAGKRR